jgi:hypothetical protein
LESLLDLAMVGLLIGCQIDCDRVGRLVVFQDARNGSVAASGARSEAAGKATRWHGNSLTVGTVNPASARARTPLNHFAGAARLIFHWRPAGTLISRMARTETSLT